MKAFIPSQKGIWIISGLVLIGVFALLYQYSIPERIISFFRNSGQGKYWNNEVDKFRNLYTSDSMDCIFLGDSQIEQCEWQELIPELRCINRGIGGESTSGLLLRLNCLPRNGRGKFVFLQTGTNDILGGKSVETVIQNYAGILDSLSARQYSVVPTLVFPLRYLPELNSQIRRLNDGIKKIAQQKNLTIIDINPSISDADKLSAAFSNDGVHLNADGYRIWLVEIKKHLPKPGHSGFR